MLDDGLIRYGVPILLIGAMVIIALATLVLHLLFPTTKRKRSRRTVSFLKLERCPSCQHVLDREERCGVSIKICSQCQGVWLSQGQLEQLMR
jgi:hypothetical protein